MSITIDLPAPVLAALREESDATGQPIEQIVVAMVAQQFAVSRNGTTAQNELDLTDEDRKEIAAALDEALEDDRAGRTLTLEELDASIRALLDVIPDTSNNPYQTAQPIAKAA